jgi:UV DNA damage repair endonuclease
VQSEDYLICDSVLEVCGVWCIDLVLYQHLTRSEEAAAEEEEEVAEHKAYILECSEKTGSSQKVHISI